MRKHDLKGMDVREIHFWARRGELTDAELDGNKVHAEDCTAEAVDSTTAFVPTYAERFHGRTSAIVQDET